jgi:ABC-type uncharacterized transport system permease subunit
VNLHEAFDLLLSVGRFAAPLILAAMAGLYSERSGIIQIALEGFMLIGAFAAATAAYLTGQGSVGMLAAIACGVFAGTIYGGLTIRLKADQIVAGTVINMLAWGGIPVISKIIFDSTAGTPALPMEARLGDWMPIVFGVTAVGLTWGLLTKTAFGLWLTVAGEKPKALAAVGIKPTVMRWYAVAIAGGLAGIGGAVLSICLSSSYTRNMAAGRGFMALAALILGKWRPIPTLMGCLLFGVCEVLQLKLQNTVWPGIGEVPVQLVQVAPYVLTLLLLAGVVGESRAPAALGQD